MILIVSKIVFFLQKKTFLLIFVECVLCEFLSYNNDQLVKTHLIYQEKMMARTRNSRAHFRARCARSECSHCPKTLKNAILKASWRGAQRARECAHVHIIMKN